jgi:carboxyl-terminal processing protease
MKAFIVRLVALSLLVIGVIFLAGCVGAPRVASPGPSILCPPHLQKLCTVYNTVQREYIKEISDEKLTEMFISGFFKELNKDFNDPYSKYISVKDKEAETISDENYAGIGVDMIKDTKAPYTIKVQRVFRGTPAYEAGLRRGDRITHIDTIPVGNKTIAESRDLIRGKVGTVVTLTISRFCERVPFGISIRRKGIEDTISGIVKMVAPHIAYAYIPSFDAEKNIALRVGYSLQKFLALYGKPHGLIIDERNNPGGSILHGQYFVSLFVRNGTVLYSKTRTGKESPRNTRENNHDLLSDVPIVLLINNDTKSTAEIVAGAMQDLGRATIVGTKSFGKSVVQTPKYLSDGSEFWLTTEHWFTPNHTLVDKTGITPDISVEEAPDESCTGDRQLAVALEVLRRKNIPRNIVAQQ